MSPDVLAGQTNTERTDRDEPSRKVSLEIPQAAHSPDLERLERTQVESSKCGMNSLTDVVSGSTSQTTNLIENVYKSQSVPNFNCLISIRQVHENWSRRQTLLVDVRRASEFERFRIPGSLNLAAFSIKSKPYLKRNPIVLVNEGRYLGQLERDCEQLKAQGFQQVGVMSGGLNAWYRAGYPVAGERLDISRLNRIEPSEWIAAIQERDWKYIDLDGSLQNLANLLPASSVIEYPHTDKRKFITQVNLADQSFDKRRLSGYLVVSNKGDEYESVEHLLQLTDATSVFFLSGGMAALQRYLNTHSSLISRLARGFKELHRCSG